MRTVYKNGTIYTGNGFVTDFAVENGKFCFVGETDKATADEVVDLGGKFVCAGFNDSHMHVLNLGNVLTMANLGAHTTSLKEMLDCLRTYIKETGVTPGTWVQGRGFNHDYFSDAVGFGFCLYRTPDLHYAGMRAHLRSELEGAGSVGHYEGHAASGGRQLCFR